MWQDTTLSIIGFTCILTLIPSIVQNLILRNVTLQSCITSNLTAMFLIMMCAIFFTFNFPLGSFVTAGKALTGYILLFQKSIIQKKGEIN